MFAIPYQIRNSNHPCHESNSTASFTSSINSAPSSANKSSVVETTALQKSTHTPYVLARQTSERTTSVATTLSSFAAIRLRQVPTTFIPFENWKKRRQDRATPVSGSCGLLNRIFHHRDQVETQRPVQTKHSMLSLCPSWLFCPRNHQAGIRFSHPGLP